MQKLFFILLIYITTCSWTNAQSPEWAKSEFYCENGSYSETDSLLSPTKELLGAYCPIVFVEASGSVPLKPISGHVVLKFKVTKIGTVQNVSVVQSTHKGFERRAVKASLKMKFKPMILDGENIDIPLFFFKYHFLYN